MVSTIPWMKTNKTQRSTYTQTEINIISEHYDGTGKSIEHLSTILNRTKCSIYSHIVKHKMTKKPRSTFWKTHPEAIEEVRELAESYTPHQIALIFNDKYKCGLTTNAIRLIMSKNKISGLHRSGWFTMLDIQEMLCVDSQWIVRRIKKGYLKIDRHNNHLYKILEADFLKFIDEYPSELNGLKLDFFYIYHLIKQNLLKTNRR